MVDKCLESIYLLDEIEVYMKHVTGVSNVAVIQEEKIVTAAVLVQMLMTGKTYST